MDQVVSSKLALSSLFGNSVFQRGNNQTFNLISELGQSGQEFTARLKSYRRWTSKPVEVSPWLCSRYGWYRIEKDLLQCVDCRQYLSAHLPLVTEDDSLHRKSIDRLRSSLLEAHTKTCLWRSNITSESICSPNVSDYQLAINDFTNRLQSLLSFFPFTGEKRYVLADTIFDNKGITESDIANLIETVKMSGLILLDENISKEACFLALLGWKKDESCKECICCDFCLRRIGLWIYGSKEILNETEPSSTIGNIDKVQRSPKSDKRLDPINQHYKWCPWVMAVLSSSVLYVNSKEGDGSSLFIPTWLALFRLITNRGVATDFTTGTSLTNKEELSEHYVLARQLLDEALDCIDTFSSQADTSTTSEDMQAN